MKGLFKSMMFVAVAAMTFTACEKDNNDLNNAKRVVEFTANIGEDTRSGFVDKAEGESAYKSQWDGTETLFVMAENTEKWPSISADGKFSVEFDAADQFASIYSPVASWEYNASYGIYMPVIPQTQTPRANSVDPYAHILSAQNIYIAGTDPVTITMEHQVAYGKMTVNTPADFEISKVVISLTGAYFGVDKSLSYTINADNVENNVFWFATEPIKVSEFTVKAYSTDDKIMSKTVAVEADKLNFDYGRVGSFSVSNLTEEEVVAAPAFTTAWMANSSNYDKLVRFSDDAIGVLQLNFYNCNNENWIDVGTYGFAYSGAIYPGGGYSFFVPAGGSKVDVTAGSVVVSVVDGVYFFEFIDLDYGGQKLNATYKGEIQGLIVPDSREVLATPVVESTISGKTITLSWGAIENAEGYYIECTSSSDIEPISTTDTTVTITVPSYSYYSFSIQAVVSADNASYRSSEKAYAEYNDPRAVLPSPSNVTATIDGAYATISWDPVEGADGYMLSYYLNGNHEVTVEGASCTLEVGFNVSDLWVYVFSTADDDNPDYRSSESWNSYVVVNTDRDPNIIPIVFTSCEPGEYIPAQWRVSYNFSDDNGNSMTLWITTDHGATNTSFGETMNYNNFYSSPGSVGNYYRFCPVDVVVNGVNKTANGGNVSIENLGTSWDIEMDILFDDGTAHLFTYSGGVGTTGGDSGDSGDDGEFTPDYTITSMSFVQLSTSYYSYQWNLSTSNGLSFRIYTPYSQGETLQEGTYTYYSGNGNTNGDFTFSTRMFSPAPGSGSMVVSKDGDTYTINLTLVVGASTQKYQYVGTL